MRNIHLTERSLLDTLHVAFTIDAVYTLSVTHYGDYFALLSNPWFVLYL